MKSLVIVLASIFTVSAMAQGQGKNSEAYKSAETEMQLANKTATLLESIETLEQSRADALKAKSLAAQKAMAAKKKKKSSQADNAAGIAELTLKTMNDKNDAQKHQALMSDKKSEACLNIGALKANASAVNKDMIGELATYCGPKSSSTVSTTQAIDLLSLISHRSLLNKRDAEGYFANEETTAKPKAKRVGGAN